MFTLDRSSYGPRGTGGSEGPVVLGQAVICQESNGEGLGDVIGLEIARGECTRDHYHGSFMKKQPSR